MAELPVENRTDAEKAALYFDDSDGKTYKRTSAKGEFTFSGLKNGGLITIVSINNSTWTKIPDPALVGRNAISIQNYSGEEIKLNYSNSVGGYVGIAIPDKGERFYDISDQIELYAKSKTGVVSVTIEELS